jgi:hypothetical protein
MPPSTHDELKEAQLHRVPRPPMSARNIGGSMSFHIDAFPGRVEMTALSVWALHFLPEGSRVYDWTLQPQGGGGMLVRLSWEVPHAT